MATRLYISGPNFSGRSRALTSVLRRPPFADRSFFLGPYAEAALSGLSNRVADEIAIYDGNGRASDRGAFARLDLTRLSDRAPQLLSGGEQVLLALHCFSLSPRHAIAIDTALEQLDTLNRIAALDYLGGESAFDVVLIDNRIDALDTFAVIAQPSRSSDYAGDVPGLMDLLTANVAPAIELQALDFSYGNGRPIFRAAQVALEPGKAYRLTGPNGAGKTTLLKILVGVLTPAGGRLHLDGHEYRPWREGNRAFAFSTQNPDHQWCGATLREDLSRRGMALAGCGLQVPSDERLSALAQHLGVRSLDTHLYELPLAARKRLSWLWPLSGAKPWIMLDEPTLGQDHHTRIQFAALMRRLCTLGYGLIFVTHDDDFAARLPHRALTIEGMQINEA